MPNPARSQTAFIDPTGLVPVVNEVEWLQRQRPHSTVAPTDTRSAGGSQAQVPGFAITIGISNSQTHILTYLGCGLRPHQPVFRTV